MFKRLCFWCVKIKKNMIIGLCICVIFEFNALFFVFPCWFMFLFFCEKRNVTYTAYDYCLKNGTKKEMKNPFFCVVIACTTKVFHRGSKLKAYFVGVKPFLYWQYTDIDYLRFPFCVHTQLHVSIQKKKDDQKETKHKGGIFFVVLKKKEKKYGFDSPFPLHPLFFLFRWRTQRVIWF